MNMQPIVNLKHEGSAVYSPIVAKKRQLTSMIGSLRAFHYGLQAAVAFYYLRFKNMKAIMKWFFGMIKIILYSLVIIPSSILAFAVILAPGLAIVSFVQYVLNEPYNTFSTIIAFLISAGCIKIFGWWPLKILRFLQKMPVIKYWALFLEDTWGNNTGHNNYDRF